MCSEDHSEEAQAAMIEHNIRVTNAREALDRVSYRIQAAKGSDISWATLKRDDVQALLDMIGWYEGGISWATSCTHCVGLWEENYDQWHTIQALKSKLKEVRVWQQPIDVDNKLETSTAKVDSPIVNPDPQPHSGLWCYECADSSPHLKSRHRGW